MFRGNHIAPLLVSHEDQNIGLHGAVLKVGGCLHARYKTVVRWLRRLEESSSIGQRYLMPVRSILWMKCFWNARKTMTIGITDTTTIALGYFVLLALLQRLW